MKDERRKTEVPAAVAKAPDGAEPEPASGLRHSEQWSAAFRGYLNDRFDGGAFDVAFGYAPADWFEGSLGFGSGMYFLLKPRAVFFVYNLAGALKPFVLAQGSVNFSSPAAGAIGAGAGVQWDLSRNFGLIAEVPFEYFVSAPGNREATVVLFSLGAQGRL